MRVLRYMIQIALKPRIGYGYLQQECSPDPFLIQDMGTEGVRSGSIEAPGAGSSNMDGAWCNKLTNRLWPSDSRLQVMLLSKLAFAKASSQTGGSNDFDQFGIETTGTGIVVSWCHEFCGARGWKHEFDKKQRALLNGKSAATIGAYYSSSSPSCAAHRRGSDKFVVIL